MKTEWICCWRNAAYESDAWASTDRGWLFIGDICLGHYLDYGPCWSAQKIEREGGAVHAVVCGPEITKGARMCRTVEEAMAWIEEMSSAPQLCLFAPREV